MLTPVNQTDVDDGYDALALTVRARIANVTQSQEPVFATSVDPKALWGHFLHNLPEDRRQHYNCRACAKFVETYGGLVTIDESGREWPLVWSLSVAVPEAFSRAWADLAALSVAGSVTSVFLSPDAVWGQPETPDKKRGVTWRHLSAANFRAFRHPLLTAGQKMAELREERKMLLGALRDFPKSLVDEAVRVLRSDALSRSEKALAVAEWFAQRHGENSGQTWRAVAAAPTGFCHVRSTMIGTLLEDLKSGLGFEAVSRRWGEKMHPLQYQRPQAAPSVDQVRVAEETVEKLGVARSLKRRFARLEDVPESARIWQPKPAAPSQAGASGVFGHLLHAQQAPKLVLPSQRITWDKFRRTVLETARTLEVECPRVGAYYGLVTAEDPDAPPILQWDGDPRCPVSWYFYPGGSAASRWGISADWQPVAAVFESPHQWHHPERFRHQPWNALFAVSAMHDQEHHGRGLALFPENLRAELHGIRSVVEAHSKTGTITGAGTANGLAFAFGGTHSSEVTVRVDGTDRYTIDRRD